jgi:hypothetical protein
MWLIYFDKSSLTICPKVRQLNNDFKPKIIGRMIQNLLPPHDICAIIRRKSRKGPSFQQKSEFSTSS